MYACVGVFPALSLCILFDVCCVIMCVRVCVRACVCGALCVLPNPPTPLQPKRRKKRKDG